MEILCDMGANFGNDINMLMGENSMPIEPAHFSCNPDLVEVKSEYEFEVGVPPEDNNSIVYNQSKLFIKMNSKMIINVMYRDIAVDQFQQPQQLFLRAMIIFSKRGEMHMPVKRCANHRINSNDSPAAMASIVKINDPKTQYFGFEDGETFKDRLSARVPLTNMQINEEGRITRAIGIEFGCQNSCSSGINRRPTSLVFTLEDGFGNLLGKAAIEFKVCSCPKRDADREREMKRKNESNAAFPRGKRPMLARPPPPTVKQDPDSESDSNDNNQNSGHIANLVPTFKLDLHLPTEIVPDVLKFAFNAIAGKMHEEKDPRRKAALEPHLKELKKLRRRFENPQWVHCCHKLYPTWYT